MNFFKVYSRFNEKCNFFMLEYLTEIKTDPNLLYFILHACFSMNFLFCFFCYFFLLFIFKVGYQSKTQFYNSSAVISGFDLQYGHQGNIWTDSEFWQNIQPPSGVSTQFSDFLFCCMFIILTTFRRS